jgi:hypothetical protein
MDESDARAAKYLIDRGERDSAMVVLLNEKIDTLGNKIVNQERLLKSKDSTILLYRWLDLAYTRLDANWTKDNSDCDKQLAKEKALTDEYLKKLKGARRKTIFVGVAAAAAGVVVHSIIKK